MSSRSPWTTWPGGECPLPADQDVIVIRRRMIGDEPDWSRGPAGTFDWTWGNGDPDDDVVAYRLCEPE